MRQQMRSGAKFLGGGRGGDKQNFLFTEEEDT